MAKMFVCPSCHHKEIGKLYTPGNPMLEGLLWLLVIPGLIYSITRRTKRKTICPNCSTEFKISFFS